MFTDLIYNYRTPTTGAKHNTKLGSTEGASWSIIKIHIWSLSPVLGTEPLRPWELPERLSQVSFVIHNEPRYHTRVHAAKVAHSRWAVGFQGGAGYPRNYTRCLLRYWTHSLTPWPPGKGKELEIVFNHRLISDLINCAYVMNLQIKTLTTRLVQRAGCWEGGTSGEDRGVLYPNPLSAWLCPLWPNCNVTHRACSELCEWSQRVTNRKKGHRIPWVCCHDSWSELRAAWGPGTCTWHLEWGQSYATELLTSGVRAVW